MFIKDEPLTQAKIDERRFRLIHCLAIEDQMVDRILFTPFFDSEIKNVQSCVSKAGWSPIPAGYAALAKEFPEGGSVAVDKSCWDWTMPGWCVEAYLQIKKLQCRGWDDRFERLVRARFYHVVGPGARIRLRDGRVYRQTDWGLMKSGWLLTLSMNSMSQLCQHALAWTRMGEGASPLPHMWAMGDDSIIRQSHDLEKLARYEAALSTTGCLVKKSVLRREFCGILLEGEGDVTVTPLYGPKHKFHLAYLDPLVEQDTLQSYQLIYALSADRWIDRHKDRLGIDYGPLYRLWAAGLVNLKILDSIPAWSAW